MTFNYGKKGLLLSKSQRSISAVLKYTFKTMFHCQYSTVSLAHFTPLLALIIDHRPVHSILFL